MSVGGQKTRVESVSLMLGPKVCVASSFLRWISLLIAVLVSGFFAPLTGAGDLDIKSCCSIVLELL